MTWYAAHIVLLTKFLDGIQDTYPIWENVVLINASTSDEAYAIADRKGEGEAEAENHTYNGRPAAWIYMGTRKLNECLEHFDTEEREARGTEEHGTEVTYSSFVLPDEEAMQKLLANRDVAVLYERWEPEAETAFMPSEDTL